MHSLKVYYNMLIHSCYVLHVKKKCLYQDAIVLISTVKFKICADSFAFGASLKQPFEEL